ncbi:hypothetical protein HGRIS_007632 [Hohenbuehelia grisea]|uniref:Uncharacterized protein n=1 Tax=Hohenbuehelia grisea TaxID=104357 RepID=A0ABR3J5T4_9AGAR
MQAFSIIFSITLLAFGTRGTLAAPTSNTGVGGQANGGSVTSNRVGNTNERCGGLGTLGLLNMGSNNAGNGGWAQSGDSSSIGQRSDAFTGNGGQANGGNVERPDCDAAGLINLWSFNAGDGANAASGSSRGSSR